MFKIKNLNTSFYIRLAFFLKNISQLYINIKIFGSILLNLKNILFYFNYYKYENNIDQYYITSFFFV